jgi:protein SCO1/2
VLAAVALLGGVLAGCSSSAASPTPSASASELGGPDGTGTYQGFGYSQPQPRPSFTLTDDSGQQYSFAQKTAGKPTLLYFGYTHCPDVCPTTMADIGNAIASVPMAVRQKTQVVFVTTDPKTDTGPVMAKWLKSFDPGLPVPFIGLTGTQHELNVAQSAAGVLPLATDDGKQHSAKVILYGANDYADVYYLQSNNESDQIAHDLPIVAK